jgi:hypothetical protein
VIPDHHVYSLLSTRLQRFPVDALSRRRRRRGRSFLRRRLGHEHHPDRQPVEHAARQAHCRWCVQSNCAVLASISKPRCGICATGALASGNGVATSGKVGVSKVCASAQACFYAEARCSKNVTTDAADSQVLCNVRPPAFKWRRYRGISETHSLTAFRCLPTPLLRNVCRDLCSTWKRPVQLATRMIAPEFRDIKDSL